MRHREGVHPALGPGLLGLRTGSAVLPQPPSSVRMREQVQGTEACCPEPTAPGTELGVAPSLVVEDVSGCVKTVGSDLRDLLQIPAQPLRIWPGQLTSFPESVF